MVAVVLKEDLFGRVVRREEDGSVERLVTRRWPWRAIAGLLAARERRALERLEGVAGVPRLVAQSPGGHIRSWLPGQPLHAAGIQPPAFFDDLAALAARLHAAGVAHCDLAKEPNILVGPDGRPALCDFQLAVLRGSGVLGRVAWGVLCREDRRHLLKHKRTYAPHALLPSERLALARMSVPARLWRATVKRVYGPLTRRWIPSWRDAEGRNPKGNG